MKIAISIESIYHGNSLPALVRRGCDARSRRTGGEGAEDRAAIAELPDRAPRGVSRSNFVRAQCPRYGTDFGGTSFARRGSPPLATHRRLERARQDGGARLRWDAGSRPRLR